jgi:hypothetical protein
MGEKTVRSKSRLCLQALSLAEYHFRDIIIYKVSAFLKRAFNKCSAALNLNFHDDESKFLKSFLTNPECVYE